MKENKLLSVVIPCFNERENLKRLLDACKKFQSVEQIEIIMVDNGSSDGSWEILDNLPAEYSFIKTYRVKTNLGYGHGILQGLKIGNGKYLGWTHADLQTNPDDILKVIPIIENSKKGVFIKGKRYGRKFIDVFFTVSMSIVNTLLLRSIYYEINAQPTIFPKEFFQRWENPPKDFSLDLYSYYLAKKEGLEIVRISVFFAQRLAGEAHLKDLISKIRYSIKSLRYTLSILSGQIK
ncbi:MAG: glycosyltransferase family 2 protein [Legionellales bacterium]|nr:glycosyltransferase family 2 protein [Legionellales bacterium]